MRTLRSITTARRAARQDHLRLQHELAAFTTPDDLLELETIMAFYPDNQTAEIRSILAEQQLNAA